MNFPLKLEIIDRPRPILKVYRRRNKEREKGNLAVGGQGPATERSQMNSGGADEGGQKERTAEEITEWTAGTQGVEEREEGLMQEGCGSAYKEGEGPNDG